MPSDLSRNEVKEEGNLLIEAVALLVQRQRETESWVAEQIWQADERAAATDRRYAELEARLEGIEQHLARLVHEIEPPHGDKADDERLARLREQVEGLKLNPSSAGLPSRSGPAPSNPAEHVPPPLIESSPYREPVAAPRAAASAQSVQFWDVLGTNTQDRWGLALIGAGAIAVLFAILTQLRLN